ncbi:MAG TPA: hypothetical protein VFH31_15460 [Pyrinomonadaceae bacterium]|nr:hypothetical protein [Pyrinomonadaceae bacterium]
MSRTYSVVVAFIVGFALLAAPAHSQTAAREGYKGVVLKSDDRKAGEQFTFANLRAPRPFVTYPSGNGAETMKVFEDNELIVLIFVANLTGSTETFYLSKKTGRFTLIEVGALEATVTESNFRPKVTYGKLQ